MPLIAVQGPFPLGSKSVSLFATVSNCQGNVFEGKARKLSTRRLIIGKRRRASSRAFMTVQKSDIWRDTNIGKLNLGRHWSFDRGQARHYCVK